MAQRPAGDNLGVAARCLLESSNAFCGTGSFHTSATFATAHPPEKAVYNRHEDATTVWPGLLAALERVRSPVAPFRFGEGIKRACTTTRRTTQVQPSGLYWTADRFVFGR